MMKVDLYNQKGEQVSKVDLPAKIFDLAINQDLVHQAVVAQMANAREAIAHTKDRGERRGGGRKPWRQKGTGRARHGSIRSPIWRGGGITFGPTRERVFTKKINKKMKTKALFMALSSKVKDKEMILLDKLELAQGKTKQIVNIFNDLKSKVEKNLDKGLLIVLPQSDQKLFRAANNLPKVDVIRADSLNVVDVLKYKYLLMLQEAIKVIEKTYVK
ncbi:MAG: 50S ribosomal protein L4 [Parcubacteria group bacterium]|nr:50S ribosomal protein L4 [Parcubacteria group bacterium]